jgi:cysteine desulfurase/selenocysteine lyase
MYIDTSSIKENFPIFKYNKKLVYLDTAATSHLPTCTIEAIIKYYKTTHSNINRGVHRLSEKATINVEETRRIIQKFINAEYTEECIFVKNTTEALNLIANCLPVTHLKEGDGILITSMEHHANIIPWRLICSKYNYKLHIAPITENGILDVVKISTLLREKEIKLLSMTHVSNVLGTINPLETIINIAKKLNTIVVIDGAQAIQHLVIDVQKLNCDFYVFSGHKIYGPTGVGILYGKKKYLNAMPPYLGGGNMVLNILNDKILYNDIPHKFEAGTPPIASIIGLGVSIKYFKKNQQTIIELEKELIKYTIQKLKTIDNLHLIGPLTNRAGIFSFTLENKHPHDVGTILNLQDIAVRTGHLCAIPLLQRYKINAVTRASLGMYTTFEDIDKLHSALLIVNKTLK